MSENDWFIWNNKFEKIWILFYFRWDEIKQTTAFPSISYVSNSILYTSQAKVKLFRMNKGLLTKEVSF